jgi:histidinol-phosphate aminotransferase
MREEDIKNILDTFPGLVIIDEAYINFSSQQSFISEIDTYPNLVVMQTLSKAWGLASLRLGLGFASLPVIELFNRVKPPYNINKASQQLAIEALHNQEEVENWINETLLQREFLENELKGFSFIKKIFPSDANFLLVKVDDANALYNYLSSKGIIVRNRSKEVMCENCLRITIGTPNENIELIKTLERYGK